MTQFWIIAMLLLLVAMFLVLMPLIIHNFRLIDQRIFTENPNIIYFKEQEAEFAKQLEQGVITQRNKNLIHTELKKKLLNDMADNNENINYKKDRQVGLGLILVLLLPITTVPIYLHLGAQTELSVIEMITNPNTSHEDMILILKKWSKKRPDNVQALFMLGNHYTAIGHMKQAIEIYKKLYDITGSSPQAAAQLAQGIFLANHNHITNEVRRLYTEVLHKDQTNSTALGLKGIDAFEEGNYAVAVQAWSQALAMETNMIIQQTLTVGINKARRLMGEKISELRVNVRLSPKLKIPVNARVIVFARASGGNKPPLATVSLQVSDLPKEVVLYDNPAMGSDSLSNVDSLDVIAQIFLSNDLTSTDYQAEVKEIKLQDIGIIQLTIVP